MSTLRRHRLCRLLALVLILLLGCRDSTPSRAVLSSTTGPAIRTPRVAAHQVPGAIVVSVLIDSSESLSPNMSDRCAMAVNWLERLRHQNPGQRLVATIYGTSSGAVPVVVVKPSLLQVQLSPFASTALRSKSTRALFDGLRSTCAKNLKKTSTSAIVAGVRRVLGDQTASCATERCAARSLLVVSDLIEDADPAVSRALRKLRRRRAVAGHERKSLVPLPADHVAGVSVTLCGLGLAANPYPRPARLVALWSHLFSRHQLQPTSDCSVAPIPVFARRVR